MNRLILIGNGFDLAHGLPTTYNDFILWYLKKVFVTANARDGYKDNLIEISMKFNYKELYDRHFITLEDFIDHYYQVGFKEVIKDSELRNLRKGLIVSNPFNVTMVPFLRILVTNCNLVNWVDIENEYYDALKQLLDLIKEQQRQALFELNQAMETLVPVSCDCTSKALKNQLYPEPLKIFFLHLLDQESLIIRRIQIKKNTNLKLLIF